MMRPTHINPKISADTYLRGTHDFNRVPLAPPGLLTVIHKSPDTRKTYAPHGLKGWYVRGAPEHYRCFDIWCPNTRRARQGETVRFFPHDHVLPGLSPHENITRSIHELIAALKYPHPASPTATFGNEQTQALIQLARIMQLALPVQPAMTQRSGLPAPPLPRVHTTPPLLRVPTAPPPPRVQLAPPPPRVRIPTLPPWPPIDNVCLKLCLTVILHASVFVLEAPPFRNSSS